MTVSFRRNPAATDVTIRIESSSSLTAGTWTQEAAWTSATGWTNASGTQITEAGALVTFRDFVALGGNGIIRRFLRMRASTP